MNVKIYRNKSANNVVSKNITELYLLESVRYNGDNSTVQNPIFIFGGVDDIGVVSEWNYMYVPKFKRYYYITDIKLLHGNQVELTCKVDVLMSYKKDIKNSSQLIARQQNVKNLYITDSQLPIHSDRSVIYNNFGSVISGETNILITAGGGEDGNS